MVERREDIEILEQNDPESEIQEITFTVCKKLKQITGLRIQCKDKAIYFPRDAYFSEESKKTQKIIKFEIKEGSQLNGIQKVNDPKDNSLIMISLQYRDQKQDLVVQTREPKLDDLNFDQKVKNKHQHFNIFKIVFKKGTHSYYLSEFKATECILPNKDSTQEVAIKMKNNCEIFLNSYLKLKEVQDILPIQYDVKDENFKSIYKDIRTIIDDISNIKQEMHLSFRQCSNFSKELQNGFKQILQNIHPDLEQDHSNFSPENYPYEKQTLNRLQTKLQQNLQRLLDLQPKVSKLNNHKNVISNARQNVQSLSSLRNLLSMSSDTSSNLHMAQNEIEKLQEKLSQLERDVEIENIHQRNLDKEISLYYKLLEKKYLDLEQVKGTVQEFKKIIEKSKFDKAKNLDINIELENLRKEFDSAIQGIKNTYEVKEQKINERIEAERNKMQSEDQNSSRGQSYHFIMILDESGSMSSQWDAVCKIFDEFMLAFKEKGDACNFSFSVILFDHQVRMRYKRLPANEIGQLGKLKGGGTTFYNALCKATDLIGNTPEYQIPVVLFMTDGQSDHKDVTNSKKVLDSIISTHQGQQTLFFAIGFGNEYNIGVLNELSKAANKGKQSVVIKEHEINFVMEAIDQKELQMIFLGLQKDFDKTNQIKAIEALENQRQQDLKLYQQQTQFYRDQLEQKRKDLQKSYELQKQMQEFSEKEIEKYFEDNHDNQRNSIQEEIEKLKKKRDGLLSQKSQLIIDENVRKIKALRTDIKESEKKIEQLKRQKEMTKEQRIQAFNDLIDRSKFTGEKDITQFHSLLSSVNDTIHCLDLEIMDAIELMEKFGEQINKMDRQFQGQVQQQLKKGLNDEVLVQCLANYLGRGEEEKFNDVKIQLKRALSQQNHKDYKENELFYNEILNWIDLSEVAKTSQNKLSDQANRLAQRIQPPKMKKKKNDSDDDSDDEIMNEEEEKGESIFKKQDEDEIVSKVLYQEDVDKMISKIKSQVKYIKENEKEKKEQIKDNANEIKNDKVLGKRKRSNYDELKELGKELTYYRTIKDEDKLKKTIEGCLRSIHQILYDIVNVKIQKRVYREFKLLFSFFQAEIKMDIQPFQSLERIMQFDSKEDIQRELTCIEQRKNYMALISQQDAQEELARRSQLKEVLLE